MNTRPNTAAVAEAAVALTPQQDAAIHTRGVSIGLSAGAGCGKTFVITQRFLTLLDVHEPPDRATALNPLAGIVAITFTDRAAREMRDRIRAACHERLSKCPPEEVEHWLPIIRALDTARISTIHSFCASLLRSQAIDAGLDPQFGLLDGAAGDAFLRKIIEETVFDLVERGDPDGVELVFNYGLERTARLLRVLLHGRFRINFADFDHYSPETLAQKWLDVWHEQFVLNLVKRFIELHSTQRLLELLREHTPNHPVMKGRCEFLLDNIERLPTADDPVLLLSELHGEARVQGGGGKSAWSSEDVYKSVQAALSDFRDAIEKLKKDLDVDDADVQTAARLSLTALNVLRQLSDRYDLQKQREGVLDFDDLLSRTRDLLRHSKSVRHRAAATVKYLMVDEFQDTDPVQADIVKLLCGDRLLDGTLFFVGDAKQSIYRFRRADPAVFTALRENLPTEGRLPLSTNFRSQPDVLRFINCVFAPEMGESYEPLSPHVDTQLSPTPAIEFLFATPGTDDFETPLPSREGLGEGQDAEDSDQFPNVSSHAADDDGPAKEKAEQKRTREADWIARRIASLLNDNVPRIRQKNPDTGAVELRPARPGDVAIVFRALTSVWLYEEALRNHGIPYYLVGGRTFYAQQEVFDLVNLCSFLDDSDDQVSLAGVLRSPLFSISDDTLFAMVDRFGTLSAALNNEPSSFLSEEQQYQWKHAGRVLGELRDQKNNLPLAALLNLAIARTGYDASLLAEFLGRRKLANLRKLIEMARQLDRAGLESIKNFVNRIRDSVMEQTDEELAAVHAETSDVVRLMSIHQAKGLEFPIVIVADIDSAHRGSGEMAYLHPEFGPLLPMPKVHGRSISNLGAKMHRLQEQPEDAAESTRLFYVAATRAADYLILSAGLDGDRKIHSPWMTLLANRFDLQTGLPAGDPYLGRLSPGNVAADDIPAIRVHLHPPEVVTAARPEQPFDLPLDKFREAVELADAEPLPETLRHIAPDYASRRHFSVSGIEQAAAALNTSKIRERDFPSPPAGEGQGGGANGHGASFRPPRAASDLDEPAPDATTLGTIMHEVLERIDFAHPEAVDAAIDQRLRATGAGGNEPLRSAVSTRVSRFLATPIFRELCQSVHCDREIDFVLRWPIDPYAEAHGQRSVGLGAVIISGKIDCLYQSRDGRWKIVDYKTGRLPARNAAAVLEKYDIQMAIYAFAVQAAIGRKPDSVEIILVGEEITPVSLDLTDAFLSTTSRKIDEAIQQLRRGNGASVSDFETAMQ
ncbi:MAG: UvrD-helicase domain-containing protein [Planctomycetaceae bacterium]